MSCCTYMYVELVFIWMVFIPLGFKTILQQFHQQLIDVGEQMAFRVSALLTSCSPNPCCSNSLGEYLYKIVWREEMLLRCRFDKVEIRSMFITATISSQPCIIATTLFFRLQDEPWLYPNIPQLTVGGLGQPQLTYQYHANYVRLVITCILVHLWAYSDTV